MNDNVTMGNALPVHPEYLKMREQMLTKTADELKIINMPDDKTCAYGAVIDMALDGRIMTLVCYFNGEVSMLYSTGGAVAGLGQHYPNVREQAKVMLASIGQAAHLFAEPKDFALPGGTYNHVYLLTNKGKLFIRLNPRTITAEPRERQFVFMLYNRVMNEVTKIMPQVMHAQRSVTPVQFFPNRKDGNK